MTALAKAREGFGEDCSQGANEGPGGVVSTKAPSKVATLVEKGVLNGMNESVWPSRVKQRLGSK